MNARRKLFVDVSHNNNEISTENLIKKLNWRQKNNRRKHAVCFGIMGGQVNFAFHLVVKLSVELGYVFLSLRL
jgi:hypoxanthine-guanine phosphoribosyltransferase